MSAERPLAGQTGAVLFYCDDGHYYSVKGNRAGRSLASERVVAVVASIVGGPVPAVRLVEVPQALIDLHGSYCRHFTPGVWHGSQWIEDCEENTFVRWPDDEGNPERFCDLAVLYGAMLSADRQFLYEPRYPHRVWSVDHGPFLSIENKWIEPLRAYHSNGQLGLEEHIVVNAACTLEGLFESAQRLARLTDEQIASAVGSIPDHWGLENRERPYLCEFISDSVLTIADIVSQRGVA